MSGAVDVQQLEPERLDEIAHAVELRLVGDLAAEHGVRAPRAGDQAVKRLDQRCAELAADGDLVVGRLHGWQLPIDPYDASSHDACEACDGGQPPRRAGASNPSARPRWTASARECTSSFA